MLTATVPNWAEIFTAFGALIAAIAAVGTLIAVIVGTRIAMRDFGLAREGLNAAKDQLADSERTRHAQILAEFSLRWDSQTMKDSDALAREFGPRGLVELSDRLYGNSALDPADPSELEKWRANLADWYTCIEWPNFLETIGVMVDAEVLPGELVYRMWGGTIVNTWRRYWERPTKEHRVHRNDTKIYEYFQRLAEQMEDQAAHAAFDSGAATSAGESQGQVAAAADNSGSQPGE